MPLRRTGLDGRRSLRLPDHDYASSATYFVTVCTYEKLCWFGDIVEGQLGQARSSIASGVAFPIATSKCFSMPTLPCPITFTAC